MDLVPDGSTPTVARTALLVDDHIDVRRIVRDRLLAQGFAVLEAGSGEHGLQLLDEHVVHAVVLDVHLPGIDGFAVLRAIRQRSEVPVVLLSAAGDEADRVLGLELGADDYVVKPFSSRELVARVRAVLRRAQSTSNPTAPLQFGCVLVDPSARTVTRDGALVVLTPRSFDLLVFLVTHPGRTFSRDELLINVWLSEPDWQNAATVTEHMHRLRRTLEDTPDHPRHLVTVRAKGYRFDP
jgi:two-component system response regulator ResD